MDQQALFDGLKWIGGTVLAILAGLGYGKIREMREKRRYDLADANKAIHETNQGERIKADVTLIETLVKRIEILEAGQADLNNKLMSLTDTNARLDERNKALEKENGRLHTEVAELRKDNADRLGRIKILEKEIGELRTQFEKMRAGVNRHETGG